MGIRDDIVAEARTWLLTPTHKGQRAKKLGVDCVQLVFAVAAALNLGEFDKHEYRAWQFPTDIAAEFAKFCPATDVVQAGVIQIMDFYGLRQHVVIRTTEDSIIHAYDNGAMVLEHVVPPSWEAKFAATFEFPGVADE